MSVGWDEDEKRLGRLEWGDQWGNQVLDRANNGASWRPACTLTFLTHQADEVHGAEGSRGHGRISSYHWPRGQRRWALVAAYQWLSWAALHRLHCSSRRAMSQKRARALLLMCCQVIFGCATAGEASRSQPRRSWRHASRDLSLMRLWLQARAHGRWPAELLRACPLVVLYNMSVAGVCSGVWHLAHMCRNSRLRDSV